MNAFLTELAARIGTQHVLTDPQAIAPHATDWRGRYHGRPLAVALPGSRDEVVALMQLSARHQVALVPQGGNTSTCGAATPDGSGRQLVVGLGRMNKVRRTDPGNDSVTVEAGMTLAAVQALALEQGRLFPLSLASEGSCQIGGNLSTNAGGLAVLRYGTMRDLTLGLEVVLPDGSVLDALGGLRKDTSGLDVKQVFIGAEGQLGLITAATLRLFPLPAVRSTAFLGVDSAESAIALLSRVRQRFGDRLTTFELLSAETMDLLRAAHGDAAIPFVAPWGVLLELSDTDPESPLDAQLVDWLSTQSLEDGVIARNLAERAALWALRESVSESEKKAGPSIKHDIGVPTDAIPAFLKDTGAALSTAFPGCRIIAFGHAGDGNLHYNVAQTRPGTADPYADEQAVNAIVYASVARFRGTFAAEHGVGQLKKDWLWHYKSPQALRIMRALKAELDPDGRMNPGKWLGA